MFVGHLRSLQIRKAIYTKEESNLIFKRFIYTSFFFKFLFILRNISNSSSALLISRMLYLIEDKYSNFFYNISNMSD